MGHGMAKDVALEATRSNKCNMDACEEYAAGYKDGDCCALPVMAFCSAEHGYVAGQDGCGFAYAEGQRSVCRVPKSYWDNNMEDPFPADVQRGNLSGIPREPPEHIKNAGESHLEAGWCTGEDEAGEGESFRWNENGEHERQGFLDDILAYDNFALTFARSTRGAGWILSAGRASPIAKARTVVGGGSPKRQVSTCCIRNGGPASSTSSGTSRSSAGDDSHARNGVGQHDNLGPNSERGYTPISMEEARSAVNNVADGNYIAGPMNLAGAGGAPGVSGNSDRTGNSDLNEQL
ncbi:unnamed protein product [Amoebophrya sp. A25]|nr:unnamed protein product [Amoebophrya sp. A25]|eukprot:GSA25T00019604001.1